MMCNTDWDLSEKSACWERLERNPKFISPSLILFWLQDSAFTNKKWQCVPHVTNRNQNGKVRLVHDLTWNEIEARAMWRPEVSQQRARKRTGFFRTLETEDQKSSSAQILSHAFNPWKTKKWWFQLSWLLWFWTHCCLFGWQLITLSRTWRAVSKEPIKNSLNQIYATKPKKTFLFKHIWLTYSVHQQFPVVCWRVSTSRVHQICLISLHTKC